MIQKRFFTSTLENILDVRNTNSFFKSELLKNGFSFTDKDTFTYKRNLTLNELSHEHIHFFLNMLVDVPSIQRNFSDEGVLFNVLESSSFVYSCEISFLNDHTFRINSSDISVSLLNENFSIFCESPLAFFDSFLSLSEKCNFQLKKILIEK